MWYDVKIGDVLKDNRESYDSYGKTGVVFAIQDNNTPFGNFSELYIDWGNKNYDTFSLGNAQLCFSRVGHKDLSWESIDGLKIAKKYKHLLKRR